MKKLLWIALSIGLSSQLLSATSTLALNSGKAVNDSVKQKEKKYYNITVPKNKSVRVNLTELEADVDLYVKKGNEVRVRFNDCYSANSNTESEECVVSNEGESSIYTIMVNGFKQSAFTLKATVDGSEEIPTLSSDPLADAIEKKEGKQYRVEGKKGETITVTLSDLTADADLRVREGRKAGLHSFNCKSNNSGTKTEECVITPKKDATVYVHVYGYQASNYSLKAVKGTTNPCITKEELKRKIKNEEDVTKVNTSCITDMSYLLIDTDTDFNQDISAWDVSKVTNMNGMFFHASKFNKDISKWNVSNVTNMSYMFTHAFAFKGHDLSKWNVKKVTEHYFFFSDHNQKSNQYDNIAPKWKIKTQQDFINNVRQYCESNQTDNNSILCSNEPNISYAINYKKEVFQGLIYDYLRINLKNNTAQTLKANQRLELEYPVESISLKKLKDTPIYLYIKTSYGADENIYWFFQYQGKTILTFGSNDGNGAIYDIHVDNKGKNLILTYEGYYYPSEIITETYDISNPTVAKLIDTQIKPLP